jgi:hypothetical protein
MMNDVIKNEWDTPPRPAKRMAHGNVSLDYANSDDASEIDAGILETVKGVRLSLFWPWGWDWQNSRQRACSLTLNTIP